MKTIKVLALALFQTLIYSVLVYFSIRYFAQSMGTDGAASIGIIGGADGPTAIFVASKFDLSKFFHFSVTGMFVAFLIANVSALLSRKALSITILILSYLFVAVSIMVSIGNMLWMPVIMLIILAALMFGGYYASKKI